MIEEPLIKSSKEEIERLWDWLLNEANLYTNRLNFYILTQPMFFVAFASYSGQLIVLPMACSLSGIFLSLVWILTSWHQNSRVVIPLRHIIYQKWDIGKKIQTKQRKVLRTHFTLGIILPLFMILIWLIVIFSELVY